MTDDIGLDDAPDMMAAELALGLLEGDDRALALRRMLAEHGFAQDVERWRNHLAQLFERWPAVDAPRDVFDRVERTIDAPLMASAPIPVRTKPSLFWPAAAALSSVAAAALLVFIVLHPIPTGPVATQIARAPTRTAPVPAAILVASINPGANGAPVTAVYDPGSGNLRLTPAALADANRSAELWVIAGDGVPHSLGLLRTSGGSTFTVNPDNRTRLAAGAVLAVSLEPVGGSPTGLPTGPVVAKGALSQV